MAIDKEFKKALIDLSEKEKDKLIVKLMRKDKILAAKLEFELLGNYSAEELREQVKSRITEAVKSAITKSYAVGYVSVLLRKMSSEITNHVKITADKTGEIELNFHLLNLVLSEHTKKIETNFNSKAARIRVNIVSRVFKLLALIHALHEDVRSDFNEELEKLGGKITGLSQLKKTAVQNGLELAWLTDAEIPEDIKDLQAKLRKQGFLK